MRTESAIAGVRLGLRLEAQKYATRAAESARLAEQHARICLAQERVFGAATWAGLAEGAALRCGQYADLAGLYAAGSVAHHEALRSYTLARLHSHAARRAADALLRGVGL